MTEDQRSSEQTQDNSVPIIIETPSHLKAETLQLFTENQLTDSRKLVDTVLSENMAAFRKTIQLKRLADTRHDHRFETPPILEAGEFGQYLRNGDPDTYTEYVSNQPDAPIMILDLGSSVRNMNSTEPYQINVRLGTVYGDELDGIQLEREFESENGHVFTEKRKMVKLLPYAQSLSAETSQEPRNIELAVEALKWFHDDDLDKTLPKWIHEDQWEVHIRVKSEKGGSKDIAAMRVNRDKHAIVVMPNYDWTNSTYYYPTSETVGNILPQLGTLIPLQGQFIMTLGEYANQLPPQIKPQLRPVIFK